MNNVNDALNNIDLTLLDTPLSEEKLKAEEVAHPPRILMLYGSLRERSYSRLTTEEAARLLTAMGAEVKLFNPSGLPLPDDVPETHPKVAELRQLVLWSEGMVWCSPERHGAMTGIMKTQIDWIPLTSGGPALAGENPCCHAGQRRLTVFQRRKPDAYSWALDADDHYPEPVIRCKSLGRV